MIKELKFTPENLKRHMDYWNEHACNYEDNQIRIVTTRDHKLGKEGDIFRVDGIGYFVLSRIETYASNSPLVQLVENCIKVYEYEGFNSKEEMFEEIISIYKGIPKESHIHKFIQVFGIDEATKRAVPKQQGFKDAAEPEEEIL